MYFSCSVLRLNDLRAQVNYKKENPLHGMPSALFHAELEMVLVLLQRGLHPTPVCIV